MFAERNNWKGKEEGDEKEKNYEHEAHFPPSNPPTWKILYFPSKLAFFVHLLAFLRVKSLMITWLRISANKLLTDFMLKWMEFLIWGKISISTHGTLRLTLSVKFALIIRAKCRGSDGIETSSDIFLGWWGWSQICAERWNDRKGMGRSVGFSRIQFGLVTVYVTQETWIWPVLYFETTISRLVFVLFLTKRISKVIKLPWQPFMVIIRCQRKNSREIFRKCSKGNFQLKSSRVVYLSNNLPDLKRLKSSFQCQRANSDRVFEVSE